MLEKSFELTEANAGLDISSLEWSSELPKGYESLGFVVESGFHYKTGSDQANENTKYTYKEISFEGSNYIIAGRDDKIVLNSLSQTRSVNLYFAKSGGYVNACFDIDEYEDQICVERSIVRRDPDRKLAQGLGRKVFEASEEYLQWLANSENKQLHDRIDRSPGFGGVPLSKEDWNRMFLPLLEKFGYTRASENTFYKYIDPKLKV